MNCSCQSLFTRFSPDFGLIIDLLMIKCLAYIVTKTRGYVSCDSDYYTGSRVSTSQIIEGLLPIIFRKAVRRYRVSLDERVSATRTVNRIATRLFVLPPYGAEELPTNSSFSVENVCVYVCWNGIPHGRALPCR